MANDQKTIRMAVGWNKYEDITLAQLNEELEEIRKVPKKVEMPTKVDLSPAKDVVEYKWVEEVSTVKHNVYHKWCLEGTDWSIYEHSSWPEHPFYVYIGGMDPNGKEEAFPTLEQAKKRAIELMTGSVVEHRNAINPPPPTATPNPKLRDGWVQTKDGAEWGGERLWKFGNTGYCVQNLSSYHKDRFWVYDRGGLNPGGVETYFPTLDEAMIKAEELYKASQNPVPKLESVVLQHGLTITSQYNGLKELVGYILTNIDGEVLKVYPTLEGAKKGAERIQKRLDKQADIEASKRGEADLGLYRAIGLVEDRIKKTKHKFESIYVGPGVTEEYDMKRGELNALEALSKSLKKMLSTHGKDTK